MALALAEDCLDESIVLQIGANNGLTFDALHAVLEHSCWNGLLVEGDPIIHEQLRDNNKHRESRIRTLTSIVGLGEPAIIYSPHPATIQ